MIYIVNNCFSTDHDLQLEVLQKLYPNAKSYIVPEKVYDYLLFFKYGEYDEQERKDMIKSYFNLNIMSDYKSNDYIFIRLYDDKVMPYFISHIGTRYVKFVNIVRNSKELFQYFNPFFYNFRDNRTDTGEHTIYGFFEMMNNGLKMIDVNNVETIYFNDLKFNYTNKEYKINDLSLYNQYKANFSDEKWRQVVIDEKSVQEVFGENV